jgi:magnesium chelatase family protein
LSVAEQEKSVILYVSLPGGYYGDAVKACTPFGLRARRGETACAPSTVTKYQKCISGLLLDRIDIHVEVPRVDYQKLSSDRLGESSETI